ncbi:EAL domain-containing protein, partial [Raoultella ornithinolytica]|uniref:EAL domain-containing protein n=1 Tax=Raoultella ornithinolytica TaxID=54291 RepID=UPI00403DD84D
MSDLILQLSKSSIYSTKPLERLVSGCRRHDIQHRQIKLEITEDSRSESGLIAAFCQQARQHGFMISLDDFGTGTANIGVRLENGIYGHSRFCNTDFDDKLAC